MWNYRTCPICGKPLDLVDFHKNEVRLRCADSAYFTAFKTLYHYEVLVRNFQPFHETMVLPPFVVDSYEDCTNISTIDQIGLMRHVVEVPRYLTLPWGQPDKVRDKLKLYTLIS